MIKLFFSFILLLGCSKKPLPVSDNHLRLSLGSPVATLDTALAYDTVSSKVVGQINEPLFQYHYLHRPYKLIPLLAEDFPSIKNNGLVYEFKIKKNIKYHPNKWLDKGRTVTAQDFVTQIKRLAFAGTKSTGWWLFDGRIEGLNQFRESTKTLAKLKETEVAGLQAIDTYTLRIKLTRPYPQLLAAMAMAFTSPMPIEQLIGEQNKLNRGVVGTGAYKLDSWNNNSGLELSRFKQYHQQTYPVTGDKFSRDNKLLADKGKSLPFIDKISFKIMKEAQTRWLNFLKGNIDFIVLGKENFPLAVNQSGELNDTIKKAGYQLQIASTLTYWWLAFNMQDPIIGKNLNLRKAIAHAIDIDKYIKVFTNNIALKANSIFPPGVPGYDPSRELPFSYDLDKAKLLLKQAGYPAGKGLAELVYDVRGNSTVNRQMGEFIKSQLAKIGIKIKVVVNSFPQFLRKARNQQLQVWQGGWAMDYPDPENVVQLLTTKNRPPGPNSSAYSNQRVDNAYKIISTSTNKDKVEEQIQIVQNQVEADLPWAMQYYTRNYILFSPRVRNYYQSDLVYNDLKYLRLL